MVAAGLVAAVMGLVAVTPVLAQTPTGTVSGHVTDPTGLGTPGVSVSLKSPALQGTRTAVTSQNGDFIFSLLPPGTYTVAFQLSGFAAVTETREVAPMQTVDLNVGLKPSTVKAEVTVSAETSDIVTTSQSSTTLQQDLMSRLPTARTMAAAAALAPNAHTTGPNGAFSIGGAMSFENAFLLNGVQIQDNLRGTPFSLYIEDALQTTTTTTSGVSAEYGRFSGGLVNAVTKSGGNDFSGSYRATFNNDDWRTASPFGEPKTNDVVPTGEFTLGGPLLKNRSWFFLAGRLQNQNSAAQTAYTNQPYTAKVNEKRIEGKITQTLSAHQNLQIAFTGVQHKEINAAFPNPASVMDVSSLVTRDLPQSLVSVHYSDIVSPTFFVEAQFAARHYTFEHNGGLSTDLVAGTLFLDQTTGAIWHAPAFCGVCANEDRNNQDVVLKGTKFFSTGHGAHSLVFGYDGFDDERLNDNHQSGSDFHIWATGSTVQDGVVYPVVNNDRSTWIMYFPITQSSLGTHFRTNGVFVNDNWQYGSRVTFDLGVRWDGNHGRDSGGVLVANDQAISPRLGIAWDPSGKGQWRFTASYSQYVAALANNVANGATGAGQPSVFGFFYQGPAINTDPTQPLVSSDAALEQIFDWFNANGGTNRAPFVAQIPGLATQIRGTLVSPHSDEFAAGVSRTFGAGGVLRVDAINRTYHDFYTDRIDTTTGQVTDDFGQAYDLDLIQNTNAVSRRYRALVSQISLRPTTKVQMGASYTLSSLRGNIDGENVLSGPVTSGVLSYPEYTDSSWNNPVGNLAADQRHRGRVWATFELPTNPRVANISFGVLQTAESGTPYGAIGQVHSGDFVDNPGYNTPPDTVNYFFTPRDAFHTAAQFRTDLSINVSHKFARSSRGEIFFQAQVLNVFNQFQLFNLTGNAINTTVHTSVDDPSLQPFNPFTDTPVEGVNWRKGDSFGQPVSAGAFTLPRTFFFSVGARF
jgi:outer membrane receptor protein involved in Fe transport